jgi:mRNA interferase RelE/StbE
LAYKIQINRAAQKQMLDVPVKIRLEIVRMIDHLGTTPRPAGCKKLRGTELWRVKQGQYRVVYFIDDGVRQITVLKVARRREDTYKGI